LRRLDKLSVCDAQFYGNRRTLVENGFTTKNNYDALDRLLESVSDTERKVYNYDNRGNQTSIIENGTITKTFTFDAANMPDSVDTVYIYSHGNERGINFGSEGNYATTDAMTYDGKIMQEAMLQQLLIV
jgi:hypothetical protein